MSNNSNKDLWLSDRKKYDLKWPDENVIRFLNRKYKEADCKALKVMDFGCGSGRNTIAMADMGFEIYAVDYNSECLQLTREKLEGYNAKVHFIQNEETVIPIEDNSFHIVVAWGALFYLERTKELMLMKELSRVLRRGGSILADYRTKDDSLYGKGIELEKDFYKLDESCGSLSGITYAFREIEELKAIYKEAGLHIDGYEKIDRYTNDMQRVNSHYVVWGSKN